MASAQGPPSDAAASDDDASTAPLADEEAPEAPADAAQPPVQVEASLTHGVRVIAPELAHFTVELHAAVWLRAIVESTQDPVTGGYSTADYFAVPLARPQLALSAFDGLVRTFMQPELAGPGARLLDMQLEIGPDPAFAVRVGQFRTPFTRAFVTAILLLSFPDRGVIANTFLAGRDTGIAVFGTPLDGVIEYYFGVFNGSGINGRIGDTPMPMFVGRFVVTPVGRMPYSQTPSLDADDVGGLSFGINGYYRENDVEVMGAGVAQETAAAGGDVAVALGPFYFQAEGFFQAQRLAAVTSWTSAWGAYAQAGLFVLPRIVEVSARAGWADADIDAAGGLVQSYEAAVSGYFALNDEHYGQHLKLIVSYRFADNAGPATFGDVPPASSHRVIAHIQIWF